MRIYFYHTPGNIHPVYQEMLSHPPEGVEFINASDFGREYQKTAQRSPQGGFLLSILHKFVRFLKQLYFLPNITYRKYPGDLVYSCGSIPILGDYILDIESYESLNRFSRRFSENIINKWIVQFLLKQKRCKGVICWSESAKKSVQAYHGALLNKKLHVVYPAIYAHTNQPFLLNKNPKTVQILFVGRFFERKGGRLLLSVASEIVRRYQHVRFVVVSSVEDAVKREYKSDQLTFRPLLPRKEVEELFRQSDIYLMPTFYDTFGFVFLEAFACGCVPVGLDDYAVPEIIEDGVDGFVISGFTTRYFNNDTRKKNDAYNDVERLMQTFGADETNRIIKELVEKIVFLITNRVVRESMRENGLKKVREGKFSSHFRNKQLLDILYDKSL